MPIQTLNEGDEINVAPLNNNFTYLNGEISTVNATVTNHTSSINTLNTAVNNLTNIPIETLTQTPAVDGYKIELSADTIGKTTISDKTTFILPSVSSNNVYHQIMVLMNMPTVKTIDLGTEIYFNGIEPNLTVAGNYTIVYEYDGSNWVVGAILKKAAE